MGLPTTSETKDMLIFKKTSYRYEEGPRFPLFTFKNDELDTLRSALAAKTRECTLLSNRLDAAAGAIAALHHDNTLLRQELDQRGHLIALDGRRGHEA